MTTCNSKNSADFTEIGSVSGSSISEKKLAWLHELGRQAEKYSQCHDVHIEDVDADEVDNACSDEENAGGEWIARARTILTLQRLVSSGHKFNLTGVSQLESVMIPLLLEMQNRILDHVEDVMSQNYPEDEDTFAGYMFAAANEEIALAVECEMDRILEMIHSGGAKVA